MKMVALVLGVVLSQFAAVAEGVSGSLFIDAEPSYNYTAGIVPDAAHTYPLAAGETLTSSGPASDIFLNAEETTKGHIIGYKLREFIGGEWQERALVAGTSYTYTQSEATEARLIWVWAAEHQLTIDVVQGGTVAGATSGEFVSHDASVTLTATPEAGYEFLGWVGDVESAENPVTFAMNSPKRVIPSFRELSVEKPEATEPVEYGWGWSNQVTIAEKVYSVLAFTKVGTASAVLPNDVTTLDYLVVGGGGSSVAGGGGAGGCIYRTAQGVTGGGTLAITVGAGGWGGAAWSFGGNGGDSKLVGAGLSETAVGGGAGAWVDGKNGGAGGSGGGSSGYVNVNGDHTGGAATAGQGNPGGGCKEESGLRKGGAGGGGAGGAGADAGGYGDEAAGLGGAGIECAIVGTNVWYAAGGGGGTGNGNGQLGGSGIGGHGGGTSVEPTAGAANTGSGGGGAGNNKHAGGAGGSGIVIIRYLDSTACVHKWVVDGGVVPSCDTAGSCEEHCAKCGEHRSRVLPASHTWEAIPAVAATRTTTGLSEGRRCSVCGHVEVEQVVVPKLCAGVERAQGENRPVRVLMVGHSFTEFIGGDSGAGLNAIGHKVGEQVDVTALYRGGCSLSKHWEMRETRGTYERITSTFDSAVNPLADAKVSPGNWSLKDVLDAYDWDVVVLQNSPALTAMDSYGCLGDFVAFVGTHAPNAQVYFHQTWSFDLAYPGGLGYMDEGFNGDIAKRDGMYDEIVRYSTAACAACGIEIIPCGLAVQLYRYRKPVVADGEDIVSSDHQHLGGNGNFLVAWTWCRRLFGKIPTAAQYPSIDEAAFLLSCSFDAANSYDYLNYKGSSDPVEPPVDPVEPPEEPVDPPIDPVDPIGPTDPTDPIVDPVIPKGNTNWIANVGFDGTDPKWGELPVGAAFANNRLVMNIGDELIGYPGLLPIDVVKTNLTVHSTMTFPAYEVLPTIAPDAKAGAAALATPVSTNYWVIAKKENENANVWVDTGIEADTVNETLVRIIVTTKQGVTSAKYQFGDAAPMVRTIYAPSCAQGVLFTGAGTVSTLEGWYNTPRNGGGPIFFFY